MCKERYKKMALRSYHRDPNRYRVYVAGIYPKGIYEKEKALELEAKFIFFLEEQGIASRVGIYPLSEPHRYPTVKERKRVYEEGGSYLTLEEREKFFGMLPQRFWDRIRPYTEKPRTVQITEAGISYRTEDEALEHCKPFMNPGESIVREGKYYRIYIQGIPTHSYTLDRLEEDFEVKIRAARKRAEEKRNKVEK